MGDGVGVEVAVGVGVDVGVGVGVSVGFGVGVDGTVVGSEEGDGASEAGSCASAGVSFFDVQPRKLLPNRTQTHSRLINLNLLRSLLFISYFLPR